MAAAATARAGAGSRRGRLSAGSHPKGDRPVAVRSRRRPARAPSPALALPLFADAIADRADQFGVELLDRDDLLRHHQQRPVIGVEVTILAQLARQLDHDLALDACIAFPGEVAVEALTAGEDGDAVAPGAVDLPRPLAGRTGRLEAHPPLTGGAAGVGPPLHAREALVRRRAAAAALVAAAALFGLPPRLRDLVGGIEQNPGIRPFRVAVEVGPGALRHRPRRRLAAVAVFPPPLCRRGCLLQLRGLAFSRARLLFGLDALPFGLELLEPGGLVRFGGTAFGFGVGFRRLPFLFRLGLPSASLAFTAALLCFAPLLLGFAASFRRRFRGGFADFRLAHGALPLLRLGLLAQGGRPL